MRLQETPATAWLLWGLRATFFTMSAVAAEPSSPVPPSPAALPQGSAFPDPDLLLRRSLSLRASVRLAPLRMIELSRGKRDAKKRKTSMTIRRVVRPIGRVRGNSILIHRRWAKALQGIEGFSHLMILFWLDRARKPDLRIHPKGIQRIPKIGYLATRTPHRANPIGLTVVKLLKRRGTRLMVKGLDAWNGTAILDIKPYTRKDAVSEFRMPGWVRLLDRRETDPLRKYVQPGP